MISIVETKNCCGCSACAQKCPKKCISMEEDDEGFLYPVIDFNICINCGICEKVCPMLINLPKGKVLNTYIAYHKNEETRLNSSSGGIFSAFATEIFKLNGIVYGAAFDNNFTVHHIGISSEEKIFLLQGSKYLQSRIEKTFIEVKNLLENDKIVLYSGTACQIAGLKAYLGREYSNLYTIDILCHGVPSPKLWKRYINEQEKLHNSLLERVSFRNKKYGWKSYNILLNFVNNTSYEKIFTKDPFMQMFLRDICLRPSCYSCRFKEMDRSSDITIGDCWGVENHHPYMDDNKGTSCLFIHTDKGINLFKSILSKINYVSSELDLVLPSTAHSRISVKPHRNRNCFFIFMNKEAPFEKLIELTLGSLARRIASKIKYYCIYIKNLFRFRLSNLKK